MLCWPLTTCYEKCKEMFNFQSYSCFFRKMWTSLNTLFEVGIFNFQLSTYHLVVFFLWYLWWSPQFLPISNPSTTRRAKTACGCLTLKRWGPTWPWINWCQVWKWKSVNGTLFSNPSSEIWHCFFPIDISTKRRVGSLSFLFLKEFMRVLGLDQNSKE